MATLAPKLPYTHPFAGGFPYRGSQRLPSDPDALTYLAAVAAADGAPVETAVAMAVDDFFRGIKADNTFSAIKAACLLCGARTLAGALVPLVGAAPTNNNFLPGDYNRETGLVGDGSTKYLDSGRDCIADGQDDSHFSVFVTQLASTSGLSYLGYNTSTAGVRAESQTTVGGNSFTLLHSNGSSNMALPATGGLVGASRSSASAFTGYSGGNTEVVASTSVSQSSASPLTFSIFRRNRKDGGTTQPTDARLAFYSIGESLDLALLDAHITALVTAIGAAL